MKIRRITGLVAASAATALVLAACGGSSDDDTTPAGDDDDTTQTDGGDDPDDDSAGLNGGGDDEGLSGGSTLSVGWNQPFYEYNDSTATGNATANAIINYMIRSGFQHYDQDLNLAADESFGSIELVSDEPLQIQYSIAEEASWSDGEPVTAVDVLLEWAAISGHFNTLTDEQVFEATETDDEGNVTNQDELDALLEGEVYFNGTSPTVAAMDEYDLSDDLSSVTFTYNVAFADWQTNLGAGVPAHVVGMHALEIDDPTEARDAVVAAIADNDREALTAISEFWNTGFQMEGALPDDESLYLSSGPYLLTEINGAEYVTLERNPDYTGNHEPQYDTIVVRYSEDPQAQLQALENGEIDIMSPQATVDLLEAANGLGAPFEVLEHPSATYEHLSLAMNNEGPFDPAYHGGDAEAAWAVREAFLQLVPRSEIVDVLITPLAPDADVRNAWTQVPGSPMYDGIVSTSGMDTQYAEPDQARAEELLEQAGVETPVDIRLMYGNNNERRAQTYTILAEAMSESGLFNLVDAGTPQWGSLLSDTSLYDASLFGWQSTSTSVLNSSANFVTGGINNFGGFSDAEVDQLASDLEVEVDAAEQERILGEIERIMTENAYGVTLYQHPGVTVYNSDTMENVIPIAISPTIFWNFWEWAAPSGS